MGETHGDYVKHLVKKSVVKVRWIASKENVADIMGKPLFAPDHVRLRDRILNID